MSTKWTKKQEQAIYENGTNMLVAAAAGSGKTAVLVERIINKVVNEQIDIDKLLIVTFTNAAAAEMRERILEALYKKQDEEPNNNDIRRQILLLNKANISTIHAFCLDVIKNNFYQLNVSPNFRLASTPEIELLRMEVLEDLFDRLYEENNKEFINLVNIYGGYRDDENLKETVLRVFKFIQSTPFPEEWLTEQTEKFNLSNKIEKDFANTEWGKLIIKTLKDELKISINKLKSLSLKLKIDVDLSKFYFCILDDISALEEVLNKDSWNNIYESLSNLKLKTWPTDKKVVSNLKDYAKGIRDEVKENIKKFREKIFIYNSQDANKDIYSMYEILKGIKNIVSAFDEEYKKAKLDRNIIDFNDIEHMALNILVKKNEEGKYVPTDVAKTYQNKFKEIAIDEYQDSNLVQEFILNSVSKGNNIFMVGDVKQSIYKFRQARPELFLEKYDTYNEEGKPGKKIKLYENFRSRKNVLDLTNYIFQNIMSKSLGDIEYNQDEFLNQGLEYENTDLMVAEKPEIHIIDLLKDEEEKEDDDEEILLDNVELEAKFVANKIKSILESDLHVWDKKQGYRKPTFKDFVILLRTTTGVANIYERELANLGYPVFCDTSSNYFESLEIQTIMNLLKIVDNPTLDIPLVSVLRSPIVGFTDNELVEIRLVDKKSNFYECICQAKESTENEKLKNKINQFLNLLEDLQQKQEYLKLDELIWYIYEKTGYYSYVGLMKDGTLKTANLKMLFEKAKSYEEGSFKGLYNFINFIDRVSKSGSDMGSPKLIGENENVIRIMSIHKSKGLEFPIVFLCGTSKQFNMQDLNEKILLHQDMGFGPEYINFERKLRYGTLAKEAIKIKAKKELQSEEMRLLYVALTRAREKIIITGISKNLKKELKDKKDLLEVNIDKTKINESIVEKAKSYLDWIEMAILNSEESKNVIDVYEYKKDVLQLNNEINNEDMLQLPKIEIGKGIIEKLTWKYSKEDLTKTEGKSSVSKLSHNEEKKYNVENTMPEFLKENKEKLTGAERGTIMHLVLQKLDYKEEYTLEKINELLEELQAKKIITEVQKESVQKEKILAFTKSTIFEELKTAKKVYREKAFYINIPAKEIYESDIEEAVLVQGIIDLYYIDKNDNIVLVDYKTDHVPDGQEEYLIDKYKKQLELYARAIKDSNGKGVDKIYIYSTYLGKEIIIK